MPLSPDRSVRPGLVLAAVLTCQLMVVLDATVVTIALPQIQAALHLSGPNLSWILNAYTLSFGGLLLLGARIGDILGPRFAFLGGIALFTVASLVGGASQNSGELLAARAVQGVGAALASPSALAILTRMFREGRERTRAVGLYTAVSIGGSALGLILSGLLTQWASWRWVLFINVPIGAVLLVVASGVIERTSRTQGRFDLPGALTSTVGMTSVTFGFVHAAQHGWSTSTTVVSFALGIALLVAFVLNERSAVAPITPLRLFADRNRSASYVARLLLVAGMQGMFFFLSQFLQNVLGYSPIATGLGFLPITIAVFASSQASYRWLIDRFGARWLMAVGMTSSTLATVWLTQLDATSSYAAVIGPLVMMGFGNGLAFVPLTNIALAGVRPEDAGAGAGMVNAMQQVGGSVGLAVLVTVSGSTSRSYLDHPHPGLTPTQIAHHAFVLGADRAFAVAALLLFATLVVTTLVIRTPAPPDGAMLATDGAADLPEAVELAS